jgi:putative membrane protein
MMFKRAGALAAAAALLAGTAACSTPVGLSRTTGEASSLSAVDRTFISQAAYGSLGEATLGRLASVRAGSEDVREFGRMMIAMHDQMNQELATLASQKGVLAPTSADPGRSAVAGMLDDLSGAAFDREYVAQQLADHQTSLTVFQGQQQLGRDPDLRAFAEKYAPEVERHIAMLRDLQQRVTAQES